MRVFPTAVFAIAATASSTLAAAFAPAAPTLPFCSRYSIFRRPMYHTRSRSRSNHNNKSNLLRGPSSESEWALRGLIDVAAWGNSGSGKGGGGQFSEKELEETFFLLDADSSGSVDREEFGDALDLLGMTGITEAESDSLFAKYDADGEGSIDFEEFRALMADEAFANVKPQKDIQYAMKMFRKYDDDNSGSIDKTEFKAIAAEIQAETRRRNFITVGAAVLGSLLVSEYSEEYQFAQKTFRSAYIEKEAERSQNAAFPTAMLSGDLDEAIARTLEKRGFNPKNTLFAHSVCSDEVNNKQEQLVALMVDRWGEGFSLGGLAGLPFAGKSGFRAFLHHVPDSGKLLIMFAPHVGIGGDGRIGALQRDGQSNVSNACGAAVGAYKALQKKKDSSGASRTMGDDADTDPFDPQLEKIVELLEPRLEGIEESQDAIAFVTYQMYAIVRDLVDACIAQTPDVWDFATEVAVVGGVMINRRVGGDFFQPLTFESRTKGAAPVDLFKKAFGSRPDLVPVLGSADAVKNLYTARKESA